MIKTLLVTLVVLALVGCTVNTYDGEIASEDILEVPEESTDTSQESDVFEESSEIPEQELDIDDMFAEDEEIDIGEMI